MAVSESIGESIFCVNHVNPACSVRNDISNRGLIFSGFVLLFSRISRTFRQAQGLERSVRVETVSRFIFFFYSFLFNLNHVNPVILSKIIRRK